MANHSDPTGDTPQEPAGAEPRFVPPLRADPADTPEVSAPIEPAVAPPETGDVIAAHYRLDAEIGRGAHGRVFVANDTARGNERVAVKICKASMEPPDEATRLAARTLRWFRHPNWADISDQGLTSSRYEFQVARLVDGRGLDTFRGPQPIEFVMRFLEDAAEVLDAIHRLGIIHYDVTPANFVVEQGPRGLTFVLTDGGLACMGAVRDGGRGSPLFMAPELTVEGEHDHRVDLYSLGLVAFRLATGGNPIDGGAGEVLGERRRRSAPSARQRRRDIPTALDALIASLLDREPNQRPADARALARRVADIRGRSGRTFEAVIAHQTREGPLVGRDDIVATLERSLGQLASAPTKRRGVRLQHDAVMLMHGISGVGCTRVARECIDRARQRELPVVLLSGRHSAHGHDDPLRHVMRQLDAIQAGAGGTPRPRRERKRNHDAMVEQLLRQWERVARDCPFIMVVTDYGELAPSLQRAVHVIARFLFARSEQSRMRPAIASMLFVDLGDASPDPLLNPDAEDREAPVTRLSPLSARDVERLVATRFPGFSLEARERLLLHERSEGLPRDVVALVGEAGRRGDFLPAEGSWTWRVHELERYPTVRPLDPVYLQAWDALPRDARTVLRSLALAREPVRCDVLEAAFAHEPVTVARHSPLANVIERDGHASLALASRGVHNLADTHTSDGPETLATALLDAHQRLDVSLSPLARARLLAHTGKLNEALMHLASETRDAREHLRAKNFDWAREQLERHPNLLDHPTLHASWVNLLTRSPAAIDIAMRLSTCLDPAIAGYDTARALAKIMHRENRYDEALAFLNQHEATWPTDPKSRTQFHLERAKIFLSLRRIDDAKTTLRDARHALHQLPNRGRGEGELMGRYLNILGSCHQFGGNLENAKRVWSLGESVARSTKNLAVLASTLNNIGIALHRSGNRTESADYLRRSLRLYRGLYKMDRVALAEYNLGTIEVSNGKLASGIRRLKTSASISMRYGQLQRLSSALVSLAHAYDQESNPSLANTTLRRALREAISSKAHYRISSVSQRLAPLSAALGDAQGSRSALQCSARASRASEDCRFGHFLASALSNLYLGKRADARVSLMRAARRAPKRQLREAQVVLILIKLLDATNCRYTNTVDTTSISEHLTWCIDSATWDTKYAPLDKLSPASTPESGTLRRLKAEVVLWSAINRSPVGDVVQKDLGHMTARLRRSGEKAILARALSLQSMLQIDGIQSGNGAHLLSDALQEWQSNAQSHSIPLEFVLTYNCHAKRLGLAQTHALKRDLTRTDLEALGYRFLREHSSSSPDDSRISRALKRVVQATADLRADHDLYRLLRTMTEAVLEVTGAERACVVRVTEDGGQEICVASNSIGDTVPPPSVVNLSQTVIDRVMRSRSPLLLHDVFDDDELMMRPSITKLSLRTLLCVPMVRSGHLYGVLYADSTSTAASFDSTDLEVFTLFADHAAGALESQRLVSNLKFSMEELQRAQEQLIRGERLRTIGEISSGVAHEFNNLLTSILARVQLLSMTPMGEGVARDLELIEKACMDAAEVVRRLQSFSRRECEAGFVETDLCQICRDAVEFMKPLWTHRNQSDANALIVSINAPTSLMVNGSPTELREVITNLIKNSLDATGYSGSIKIHAIEVGAEAVIVVSDNGPGVPEKYRDKIFDSFFSTKGEKGTGLGLCLCKQIVERHGGSIELACPEVGGTEITIKLPMRAEARPTNTSSMPESPAKGVRVLVVDDDENVRTPLAKFLSKEGFEVSSASGGVEGLEMIPRSNPHVVISDLSMPEMDGIEFCRHLAARHPLTPIVLMTGRSNLINADRLRSTGASALIAKPFSMRSVTRLIHDVLAETQR